ncbi:MAG: FG-GAP repeat protein [Planctomycetota bacterium]
MSVAASGQLITESRKILDPTGRAEDQFGLSVAIDGDTVLVGSPFDDGRGDSSGTALLFNVSSGSAIRQLIANDTAAEDVFGASVGLSGGVAFIGASENSFSGRSAGSAYLFDTSSGVQAGRFQPERVVFVGERPDFGFFGFSLGVSDRWLAVGAPGDIEGANAGGGAIYIYDIDDRSRVGKVFASDIDFADNFGRAVAVDSSYVVASSPFDDDNGSESGSVYVFDAATGQEVRKLLPDVGRASDFFGLSVAIDDGVVVVGAPFANTDRGTDSGVVYVFDAETGAQLFTLIASDTGDGDQFGTSVDIDGDLIVIGARFDDQVADGAGAAYVFGRDSGDQLATLRASDGQLGDAFGNAVALSGRTVVVGAPGDDDNGDFAGAAYLFELPVTQACNAADTAVPFGVLDLSDVNAFIAAFGSGDAAADIAFPFGFIDLSDIDAFIAAFLAGCA